MAWADEEFVLVLPGEENPAAAPIVVEVKKVDAKAEAKKAKHKAQRDEDKRAYNAALRKKELAILAGKGF